MGATKQIKSMVIIALLSALSFVGMYIQVSFWLAPWLKFDLSEIFCLLGGIIFGPWIGLLIVGMKNVLHYLLGSGQLIGVSMNFIAVGTMTLIVGFVWKRAKNEKNARTRYNKLIIGLIIAVIIRIVIMIPTNWLILLFTFYGDNFIIAGTRSLNGAGIVYLYIHNPVFNVIQGILSSILLMPLFYTWERILRPSLSPSEK